MDSLTSPRTARLEHSTRTARDLSQVEVTMLFCDVSRFTELTERLGDAASFRLIERWHTLVSASLARHAGEELELRGDGVLAAFGDPLAGLACAVDLQREIARKIGTRERFEVRIGLHSGPALRAGHGYFGRTLILASRIADSAAASEIAISAELRSRLPATAAFRFDAGCALQLKGLAAPCVVFRVLWRPESAPSEVSCLH